MPMTEFKVKDRNLAPQGALLVEWAAKHMPVLAQIRSRFEKDKPLKNVTVGACLHVTKETAVLAETLKAGGAKVALCGSNPLSTQDDVAAYLAEKGIQVYAWRDQKTDELHKERTELLKNVTGGTEETTTGVIRLRAMEKDGALKYPIIAVNDAYTKYLFDNRYGTGQSTIDGILRSTSLLLAGKNFVVAGYGWCGRGLAMRAKGMGAQIIVTEVDPTKALEAIMDGFRVMPMNEAAKIGDVFVTLTGDINVIRKEHMQKMKDGAVIANSGHFNVEINIPELQSMSDSKRTVRPNMEEYSLKDGRKLYLLAEGRLVNLAAAEGHPSEVMDMSFSNQALSVEYLMKNKGLKTRVYRVPKEIDELVASLKLKALNVEIDELTEEQKKYLSTWEEGTI